MSFQRTFLLLVLTWASASAQDPAEAPPGVPVPGAPIEPAGAPEGIPARPPRPMPNNPGELGKTLIKEDIIEPKLTGNSLAGLYTKYTGRRVIVSSAAQTAEMSFVQEASPENPLTFAEAAELLKIAATIENFVFVPDEQHPNWDILTLSTGGIRPTGRGVTVYTEEDRFSMKTTNCRTETP